MRCLPLDYGDVVPHIFPIFVDPDVRDSLRQALLDQKIESGIHYKPNHLLSFYASELYAPREPLPNAERAYSEMLSLPLHAVLTESDQDRVLAIVDSCVS